jgi:hypothetical protein
MSKDTKIHVNGCHTCKQNKKSNSTPRAPLGLYHAGFPMERVHLDIIGPFHKSRTGNRYILVMVDQFTKWVKLAALPEQNAKMTVRAFMTRSVSTFGCPLEIHTDKVNIFNQTYLRLFVMFSKSPKREQHLTDPQVTVNVKFLIELF